MAAVGTVVGLVEAGVHNEGEATEKRADAATYSSTPHIGRVTRFLIDDCCDVHPAAGASHGHGEVVHDGSLLRSRYPSCLGLLMIIGGGGGGMFMKCCGWAG